MNRSNGGETHAQEAEQSRTYCAASLVVVFVHGRARVRPVLTGICKLPRHQHPEVGVLTAAAPLPALAWGALMMRVAATDGGGALRTGTCDGEGDTGRGDGMHEGRFAGGCGGDKKELLKRWESGKGCPPYPRLQGAGKSRHLARSPPQSFDYPSQWHVSTLQMTIRLVPEWPNGTPAWQREQRGVRPEEAHSRKWLQSSGPHLCIATLGWGGLHAAQARNRTPGLSKVFPGGKLGTNSPRMLWVGAPISSSRQATVAPGVASQ